MPRIEFDSSNLPTSYRGKKNTTSLFDSRRLKTTAMREPNSRMTFMMLMLIMMLLLVQGGVRT